jgi:hypothetical protein
VSNRLIYDEERKYGKIPTRIYLLYLKSCGFYTVTIFFLSALGWQALRVYTDIWLRDWTEINIDNDSEMVSFFWFSLLILYGFIFKKNILCLKDKKKKKSVRVVLSESEGK